MISYTEIHNNLHSITTTTETKQHNVITLEVMTGEVRQGLVHVGEAGSEWQAEFREQSFFFF